MPVAHKNRPLPERLAWSRLSETLTYPKRPNCCQGCGMEGQTGNPGDPEATLFRWAECDHDDKVIKPYVFVILCATCQRRYLEPHPRLYIDVTGRAPYPGIMPLRGDCAWRDELTCKCPMARQNGGLGITVAHASRQSVHISCRPRSQSRWLIFYDTDPVSCSGKTLTHVMGRICKK